MMSYVSLTAAADDHGVVRRPMPGDALGSALRGVYGETPMLPDDMARLLRELDRENRRH